MTAGRGSEILLARSREWNFGFAQRKHLKSDLGFARDRRFRLANQERPLSRVTREALTRRSSCADCPISPLQGQTQVSIPPTISVVKLSPVAMEQPSGAN